MNNLKDPKHPTILFIPEVGIYPYARGLAILGEAITKRGGKVLITHDTGQMLRSPIMSMYRIPAAKSIQKNHAIYRATDKLFYSVLKRYKFLPIELSDIVNAELTKNINNLVDKAKNDFLDINYRGFPVGKMAEYDFILETKYPYSKTLSDEHKILYLKYVKNTALTIAITDKICEVYKPSLLLTFNEYAQGQAVRYSAEVHKVRSMALTYPVNFNIDASRFSIWQKSHRFWFTKHCQRWNDWKNVPIKKEHVLESWNDSVFRMYSSGSHIFSLRKDIDPGVIFKNLKLDSKRKTIIVYTSSQEERSCGEITTRIWNENDPIIDVFSNQIEWLTMLRKYANSHKDIQIIVRVHPREGSRQFGFESQHLKKLKNKFKKSTSNFIIVWPDDPISSYDLMELADVCLVSWSTIGQEAARLGIPVLSCVSNMFYPDDDFIQVATTKKEYIRKLDKIIQMKYTWKHLIKAARFYHWRTFIPSLDLSETVPRDFSDDTIWPTAPSSKVGIINGILSGKKDLIKYNIRYWQKSLPKNAIFQETIAMKKGMRILIDKIFFPPNPPKKSTRLSIISDIISRKITGKNFHILQDKNNFKDYRLKYSENISQLEYFINRTKIDSNLRILIKNGLEVILIYNGKLIKRKSPMVIRLARLYDDN